MNARPADTNQTPAAGWQGINSPPFAAWANWSNTVLLVLGLAAVRLAGLVWLPTYELVADEAQYWDWSRRLDWSYYSKGPGIAWTIAASTRIFGQHEWAVRLPAVAAWAVTALALARLATAVSGGDRRAGFFTAAAFALAPMYWAVAGLMTIDGPFIACWALALWAAWRMFDGLAQGRSSWRAWMGLALALGVGFLYKYTILLLLPGLLAYAWLRPVPAGGAKRGSTAQWVHLALAVVVFGACISPVIIWNHQRHWPTVAHLLGNIQATGGDWPAAAAPRQPWWGHLVWPLELTGAQIGGIGPVIVLMGMLAVAAVRRRNENTKPQSAYWAGQLLLLCSAAPIGGFYLVLSFFHRAQGNWPIAGFVGLMVLVGQAAVTELPRYHRLVTDWCNDPTRPKRGFFRQKPETVFQIGWHWAVGYGLVAGVCLLTFPALARLPGVNRVVPVERFTGSRALAQRVEAMVQAVRKNTGLEPFIATSSYGTTAQLAFYMPGHPTVYSAASRLGARKSSYDYFADTDLTDNRLLARPVVLVGADAASWARAFWLQGITEAGTQGGAKIFVGMDYQGPLPEK